MIKIAIVGATSYVAQSLIYYFQNKENYELYLLARTPEIITWLGQNIKKDYLYNFNKYNYDVIVNCIRNLQEPIIVPEKYDNLIIQKLIENPEIIYLNISSGAIYGKNFSKPIDEFSLSTINMNNLGEQDFYYINKIYTEAKHRTLKHLNIIDIRLFSYFNRFFPLDSHYFLAQVINNIKKDTIFETTSTDMIRDYIHPKDFLQFIEHCISHKKNDFFDIYSTSPVSKFDLLNVLKKEYNLKYIIKENTSITTVTGNKEVLYSLNRKAEGIGYIPRYSSVESILDEIKFLI